MPWSGQPGWGKASQCRQRQGGTRKGDRHTLPRSPAFAPKFEPNSGVFPFESNPSTRSLAQINVSGQKSLFLTDLSEPRGRCRASRFVLFFFFYSSPAWAGPSFVVLDRAPSAELAGGCFGPHQCCIAEFASRHCQAPPVGASPLSTHAQNREAPCMLRGGKCKHNSRIVLNIFFFLKLGIQKFSGIK